MKSVLTASQMLLATVWLAALVSIPSAADYQRQLDAGNKAAEIRTMYDSVAFLVSIALIVAWAVTSPWLQARVTASSQVRLSPGWARWGWVVPIVSLWFPRQIVGDLLKDGSIPRQQLNTWWVTWVGFSLISNLQTAMAVTSTVPFNPIQPQYEIAAACLLTASYQVWRQVVLAIDAA